MANGVPGSSGRYRSGALRRPGRWFVSCLLTVACALPMRSVQAQSKEQRAHELYIEARNHYQAAHFDEAAAALEEAYSLYPQPLILVKLGEAFEMMGAWEEALEAYRRVGSTGGEELQERVVSAIRTLESAVEKPVRVHIVSSVGGLEVEVAGQKHAVPVELELPRGEVRIDATREGYEPLSQPLRVAGAGPIFVDLKPTPILGEVEIRSSRATIGEHRLWIDDEPVAVAPEEQAGTELSPLPIASGRHILVCAQGEDVMTVPFYVRGGRTTEVTCQESAVVGGPSDDDTWAWIAAGGAAVTLTAGIFMLVDYENDKDIDKRAEGLKIQSSNKPIVGGVLAGVGGALAITSALLFADVFDDDEPEMGLLGIAPLPEGGGIGVISGSF